MQTAMTAIPDGLTELLDPNTPLTWDCIDCGMNTHPGAKGRIGLAQDIAVHGVSHVTHGDTTEVYFIRDAVWKRARMAPFDGCLCVGCLEKRLGRKLKPKDFDWSHPFNYLPATERLLRRRGQWR
jgi:hypothetical protein